jgi:hypothetical protein
MSSVFYDPAVATRLTKRQRQVYTRAEDEPPMPLMADHGFLYQTSAEELKAHLEQLVKESDNTEAATVAAEMVRRALSTRTGNIKEVMSFRKAELLRKFAGKPFDTGASRVQVRSRCLQIGFCTLRTACAGRVGRDYVGRDCLSGVPVGGCSCKLYRPDSSSLPCGGWRRDGCCTCEVLGASTPPHCPQAADLPAAREATPLSLVLLHCAVERGICGCAPHAALMCRSPRALPALFLPARRLL